MHKNNKEEMKKTLLLLLVFFTTHSFSQQRCGTTERTEHLLQKNKEYTISQVGDEAVNVYEFKSVKKATTN